MIPVKSANDRRAQTVAEQGRSIYLRVAQDGIDRASKPVNRVGHLRLAAPSVAWEIDKTQTRLLVQRRHLKAPEIQIAAPTVHEDERLFSIAKTHIMNGVGVELGEVSRRLVQQVGRRKRALGGLK